ncbi:MAG: FlgB family protein [Pseudomonadota bacterium]
MFKDLNVLQLAGAMARHAAQRQSVIAENVANANTPGFKAKDLQSFQEAFANSQLGNAGASGIPTSFRVEESSAAGTASPNGNTVSLEDQVWRGAKAKSNHDTAVTIYSKAVSLLRATLRTER